MRNIIFLVAGLVVVVLASSHADAASWLTAGSGLDGDPSETGYQIATNPCDHTFDPNTFLYYASVFMVRDGDQPVAFFGSSLFGGP